MCMAHRSSNHSSDSTPVLSWDYVFLRQKDSGIDGLTDAQLEAQAESSGQSPVLCMRDRLSHAVFWYLLPRKGVEFPLYDNIA